MFAMTELLLSSEELLTIQETVEKVDKEIAPSQNEAGSNTATEERKDRRVVTPAELQEQETLTETDPNAVFDRFSTQSEVSSPPRYIEDPALDQENERIASSLSNPSCETACEISSHLRREETSAFAELSRPEAFPGNSEKLVFVEEKPQSPEFEDKLCRDQGLYCDDRASTLGTPAEGDTQEVCQFKMEEKLNHGAPEASQLPMVDSVMTDLCRVSINHALNNSGKPWHQEGHSSLENGEGEKGKVEESKDDSILSKSCRAPIHHDSCSTDMPGHQESNASLANRGGEMCIEKTNDMDKPLCSHGHAGSPKANAISLKETKDCMMEVESSEDGESLSADEDDSEFDDDDDDDDEEEEEETDEDDESSLSSSSSSSEDTDDDLFLNHLDNEKDHEMEVESECEEGELKESPPREKKGKSKKQETSFADDGSSEDEGGLKEPNRSKKKMKDLPHVLKVSVTLEPYHKTVPVGVISSIVGVHLIVEGIEGQRPLNEGSILWLTDQRSPLGIIDELFGPVKKPFYVVRYNDVEEVPEGAKEGVHVSYVWDFADFVLNNPELYLKGYDNSGDHDEELSDSEVNFSDDEKEAEYKRSKTRVKRGNPERSTPDNGNQWHLDKRAQGRLFKKSNKNPRMRGESMSVFQSNQDFSGRPLRNQNLRFQHHRGERKPQLHARVEPMQASKELSEQASGYQSPAHQQAPSQRFPGLDQSQLPGLVRQVSLDSEGAMANQQQQVKHSQTNQQHSFPQTHLQRFPAPSHSQMPSHPPGQNHPQVPGPGQAPQVATGYGIPVANQSPQSGIETVQGWPASMQHSDPPRMYQPTIYQQVPPVHQFPSLSPHQLSGQATQLPPSMGMPPGNQIQAVNAEGYPIGVQAAALATPVLGIPAGPENAPFNYPPQAAYNQSFLPLASNRSSAIVHQGPSSTWGVPEHLRPTQALLRTSASPWQQQHSPQDSSCPWQQHHSSQDCSPQFFNQRKGPHWGGRF